jgi:Cu(I)/Ag(I) efflux system membrane fusion protein
MDLAQVAPAEGEAAPPGDVAGGPHAAHGAAGAPALPAAPAALLAVPVTAVLDTGSRRLVYVEEQPGRFAAREVALGPRAGAFYPVLSGLAEGERIVVHGAFLLDSQAQIEGRPSLLYPQGLADAAAGAAAAGHAGHGEGR